jgi:UDP-N-acetylmuramoyl-tripeptide--D-alanyl-D-alanine ligase
MTLSEVAMVTDGSLHGEDHRISSVSIDSRRVRHNGLFVAIPGERFDGHDYVGDAKARGAIGALVSRVVDDEINQVAVADTTCALGRLAAHWRRGFDVPVIGVTGSNGKTTVTAMLRHILAVSGSPLSPRESYNNQWGVPLTLLRMHAGHSHAVIEMGMNHTGEIAYLTGITQPTVALINNAAAAHLEGVGTLDQVARAKGEILSGLRADGVAVLNRDDRYFDLWRMRCGGCRIIGFGVAPEADIRAREIRTGAGNVRFRLEGAAGNAQVSLQVAGRHNVMNAVAAIAAGHAAGVPLVDMVRGLEDFDGIPGRLRHTRAAGGAALIDDSFNANPASMAAAIDVLSATGGRRVLVVGAMAELGDSTEALHASVGEQARNAGIERLLVLDDSGFSGLEGYRHGFGGGTEWFSDVTALVEALGDDTREGSTILVKGSKSSRMGRVVAALETAMDSGGTSC